MGKTSTINFFKNIILFLTLLFCGINLSAQGLMRSGTFIPFELTFPDPAKNDPPIVRGNMVITGNNILGAKLTWNRSNPREFFSHVIPFQSANGPNFIDVSPNDEYIWEGHGSSGVQYRAYTDIDSDPDRNTKYLDSNGNPVFQNLLSNESTYAGMNLANGTPTVNSNNPNLLTNGQPLLDEYDAPNYGQWLDGRPSITGPFEPGSEKGTFSSSAAELVINPDNESCSRVVRAYLYWSGLYSTEQRLATGGGGINNYTRLTRLRPECLTEDPNNPGTQIPCELYTDIKILPPGASEYVDIKFSNSGTDHNDLKTEIIYDDSWLINQNARRNFTSDFNRINGSSASNYNKFSTLYPNFTNFVPHDGWVAHPSYACRADVTSLIQNLENTGQDVDGFWTVANIRTTVGRKGWGLGAGWSLVVVYENPVEPQKFISFFDGYANVTNNAANIPISGFTTPPAGPINVEFASMSLEGDINLTTDFFRMNGTNISGVRPAGVTSNLGYNNANYFDSSILTIDRSPANRVRLSKFPNSLNNLGYDSDHFSLDNSGNGIIGNNDTSANITVSAGRNDQSATYFIGFSVDVIAPNLVVTKQTFREDGSQITLNDDIVDLGETIEYRITIENVGNEEAVYTQFQDLIPINTNFGTANELRDTFQFNNSPISNDPNLNFSTSDSGEVDANGDAIQTTLITYNIEDSVDTAGNPDGRNGLLEPNESVELSFSVQVVTDCSLLRNACSGFIENQADVTYSTLIDGTVFEIASAFEVDVCEVANPSPTPFLADQANCFITAEPISQCQEFILLEAGLGFDEYIWTFDDGSGPVAFNTDANGDATLNEDSIVVRQSGTYTVNEVVTSQNDCQNIFLSFDVETLDAFDPSINPFGSIDPDFTIDTNICPDTARVEVIEILLCEGSQTIGSDVYPAGTTLSWQQLDTGAGCTSTNETSCPFPNSDGNGNPCYVEFDNTSSTLNFDTAGDYRLIVTLAGGCPFEYYFRTIEFPENPDLQLTSGGGCSGPAELTLIGVPTDYLITFRENDRDGAILQAESTSNTFTLNPSIDFANVNVYAEAVPDVANYQGCAFGDNLNVEFSNLTLTTLNVDQPVCFTDQVTTDGTDDSKGQIFIQVSGAINYTYELENITTGDIDSENSTTSNNHDFRNVDPGDYMLRVFSANYPINREVTPAGCLFEQGITIDEFFDFDVDLDILQLTCQPAQINFDLDSSEPTPDYSQFTTRLVFSDNTVVSFSGETGSILLADTLNTPNSGQDDEGNDIPEDGFDDLIADKYIDDLLANGTTATLEVFRTNGGGSCSIERTIVINPFEVLQLTAATTTPITCSGETTQVSITATGDNLPDITGYEITSAPSTFTGTTTSTTGIFSDITAGDYTFTATQDIDGTTCTAEVLHTVIEPELITTPVIEIVQEYTCDTAGSIDITNISAIVGGTTPYTYQLLKYSDNALTTLVDTREITDITTLPYTSLTDGFYVLEIEDVNFCTSIASNTINFTPLSEVTLSLDNNPILTCDSATTPVEITATATNSGVIEGYSIIFSSNPAIIADLTDFSNTTGQFDLPAGDYEIVARTENTLCESEPLVFTVADLVNIAAAKTGGRETLTCVGVNDGSTSYSVNAFSTAGYSYTITRNATAYTPAATNPQPSTNLTATAFLLEGLEEGVYEITFLDAGTNCVDVVGFSISNPTLAVVSLVTPPQYNCDVTGIGNYTFVVTANGGETPYTFTDGATSNTDGIFTVNASAIEQTISVAITDGNSCPGTPLEVIIPATDDLQLTQTTIEQCLTDGNEVTVPFTGGVEPIQYRLDGTTTFSTAIVSGTNFIIDTNITVAGSYTYLIVDANNNDSCARELEVIFYDDIDISNLSTTTLSCDASSGATPTTGASITFEVEGGVGAYTYTFETASAATTALTPDTGSIDSNPTFTFDESFDEQLITITIANASGCGVPKTVEYTPNYPEVPVIDTFGIEEIDNLGNVTYETPEFICNGDTIEITVIPDFEPGEDINSFTYIFDGGQDQFSNSMQYTDREDGADVNFSFEIRRISTGCISESSSGIIENVDPITVGTIVTTPEICMPSTKGTATIPILNGTGPYEVTVTNLDDTSLTPIVQTTNTNSITFDPLEIGDHLVEITDDNGCILVERVEFRIIPEPNVQFRNEAIVTDCVNKVTYFFEIEDGVGPFEIGLSLTSLVDPTLFGDNISNFNDPEFDATLFATVDAGVFNATTNPGGVIDYNRVYSYTRLEFDQAYTVFVQDTDTGCFSSADVDAQSSEDLIITLGTPINTGACALNSGEIPFSFDLTPNGLLSQVGEDYVAEIIFTDGTVDNSIAPVTISAVVATGNTGTLIGLSEGSHILRIRPADINNECSGTANFLIGTEPAMGPLEIAFSRGSSCIEAAQLELRVSGGGGRMPYTYLLMPRGTTPDDSTIFTEVAIISETTILSFTDATDLVTADAFVKDASGCISEALPINIAPLIEPTLTLAPSPEDCDETGLFTTTYTIGNYNPDTLAVIYTFTVNGDTPGNSQITITDPGTSGTGTITAQNRDSYTIEVIASDNPSCPATDTFELTEDVINIMATLGEPDCDGALDFITVEVVDGGFEGIPTRGLIYEVYEGADITGTLIASVTPSPIETSLTFNSGTDYGSGALILEANQNYSVRVIDLYDVSDTSSMPRKCDDKHLALIKEPVDLPEPVTVEETPLTCSTANDGQIELGITGASASITYTLFEFANAIDAQDAIDNDTVILSGTEIANNLLFTEGNIFSNLQGASNAVYVAVVNVTSLSCPIFSAIIDLDEPDSTPLTSFVFDTIGGNCDSTDLVTDVLPQITIQVAGTLPSALTDYEISISPSVGTLTNPFTFADLALVSGTTDTYAIDANSVPTQTYTISITDVNTTCPPLEYTQAVFCDTELDQLGIVVTSPPILCFDITNTSPVTFEVTPANGNPLLFDYTITTANDPATVLDSGVDIAISPITIPGGLLEEEYILIVKDKNEARIPPVITEFEVTMPDSLPSFSLGQERTGCDTVEITATPVNASGTPNITDPAYTFDISTDGVTFNSMTPTATGNAIATVTAPVTGIDTYTIRITDANACPNTDTIDIDPQEQLNATVAADLVCLNIGNASAVITITSGTSPFTYVRTNTGTGNAISTDITNTSFPIEIDDTITASGDYEYIITDAFGCASAALPITIEDELTLSVIPMPASTACDLANNPISSRYELTTSGGDGTYTFEVAIGEVAISTNNFIAFTPTTPNTSFVVDPTQEGERFVFRVTDGLNCPVIIEPALITFPTFPQVTFSNIMDIECPGANGMADLTVTPRMGQPPYEIFVARTGIDPTTTNALTGDPLAGVTFTTDIEGVFDFQVVDANGCMSEIGSFPISNSVIQLRTFDIEDITCTDLTSVPNSGSISLSVSNTETPVEFVLFSADDLNNSLTETTSSAFDSSITISNPATDEVIFGMLTAGDYVIEVTDLNSCPFEVEATINTNADIVIGDFQVIDEDCTPTGTGITIAFPVDGLGTILLQDPLTGLMVVDPTDLGDNIFKFDDVADVFPNTTPPSTLGANDLFFVASNLAADTEYTIIAQDDSGCQIQRIFRTPANDAIENITADVTPESFCDSTDGADGIITVNFELGTAPAGTLFDIYLFEEDGVTPVAIAIEDVPVSERTFTGLSEEDYVVTITEANESPLCGNSIEVEVDKASDLILDTPSFAAANCSNATPFVVPVTATAQFGIPPYEFAIVQGMFTTATLPTGTVFNPSNMLSADTNLGVNLDWTVFVRDASGCIMPQNITITNEPEPTFVIDPEFSEDQCETAVATYTVSGIIGDPDFSPYTFTLNGSAITPDSINLTTGDVIFEVPNRGNHTIEVTDRNGCTADDTITIYDQLTVTATLGDVDCNGKVTSITSSIIGGYDETGRLLNYEVFEVSNMARAISSSADGITFSPAFSLDSDTDYVVTVMDSFTSIGGNDAPICSATSKTIRFEEIEKSSIKATPQDVSCNGATDGIVLIEDITVGEIPVTYELYSYVTLADAQAASTNNDPTNGATLTATIQTANIINEQLFENLAPTFYVAYVRNGSIACYTASEVIEILEPVLFTGTGLDVQPIQADCAVPPTNPGVEISITTVLDGEAPYFYRVPGLVENFTEITAVTVGSSFVVPGIANTNTTYTVEFTDASGITCVPAFTIPVTIDPFTGSPNLDLVNQNQPYDCFNDESITIGITNQLGIETYTFTNTIAIDFDGAPLTTIATPSTTGITSEFNITIPGRYTFEAVSSLSCISNEFEYVVRELEQLTIEATGSIVECFGDDSSITFDVLNYVGDFNFEIVDTDNTLTYTGYSVTDWGGTPVISGGPALQPASINSNNLLEIAGLQVANYEINITGSTNPRCQNTAIAQIVGPGEAISIVSAEAVTDITCLVDFAEVLVEANGGFGNYQYTITGGTVAETNTTGFFDLTSQIGAGTYNVEVFDLDNLICPPAMQPLIITEPVGPVLADIPDAFEIDCFEGDIDVTVELDLATPPTANTDDLRYSLFTYDIGSSTRGGARVVNQAPNPSETFVVFTDIEAGDYLAEVSDVFGCVFDIKPITVTEPLLLELNATVTNAFSCDNPDQEESTALATGGTAPYTYDILSETDTQLNGVSSSIANESSEGVFNISPFRILTVEVTDAKGCKATTVIETGKTIDPIEFDIIPLATKICFGSSDGFVRILNDVITGGEGDYVYTVYENDGVTIFEYPDLTLAQNNVNNFFEGLPAGDYVYEVSSNNCDVLTRNFTIEQEPEIVADANIIPVSCGGADDAEISISITEDPSNRFDRPVSFTYTLSSTDDSYTASFTKTDLNDPAVFEGLEAGLEYTWTVINNNTIGCFDDSIAPILIEDKTDITVDNGIFDNINIIQTGGLCNGFLDGAIQMFVTGGNRTASGSYYYEIKTDFSTNPDVGAIKAAGNELIVDTSNPSGDLFTVLEVFDTNVPYEIIIIDEGNGLNGDDFRSCTNIQEFIFETEDLDSFTINTITNCVTSGYTISVTNNSPVEAPEDLIINVFNLDGTIANIGGSNLEDIDILPGSYFIGIENQNTGCRSLTGIPTGDLLEFTPVQFVEMNEAGESIQPFLATNEINIYTLQVTGGVNPTGVNPYRYEAVFTDLNGNLEIFNVNSDGTFEIKETGTYVFTVHDNFAGVGEACFAETEPIGLNFIAIDIPNVFNPTSRFGTTSTWYPDNLTTNFTTPGVTSPLRDDGAAPIDSDGVIEYLDYANMEVLVFDRYGRLLAEFTGIIEKNNDDQGWDGTYQGNDMPSGDYWYLIKLNDREGTEFTGHFTLYRR